MKRLSLEKVKPDDEKSVVDHLIAVIYQAPSSDRSGAITTGEMRRRLGALDKLEAAKTDGSAFVDFEDSELDVVKGLYSSMGYTGLNRWALAIEDRLLAAPKTAATKTTV